MINDMTGHENPDISQESGAEGKERFSYDSFWKDLAGRFFYPLIKRALPGLYDDADAGTQPRFLDKEFGDVLNTADPEIHTNPHFADFVLEVPLKDGTDKWVLVHCEAQGSGGGDLAERMNFYRCLIYGHYRREPVALAIITDSRPSGETLYYSSDYYGTKVMYEYNNLVLSGLDDGELALSENPIDIVLYAAKFARRAKKELQKLNFLRKAVGLLDKRGWNLDDKRDLLLFTERIVNMKDKGLISRYREIMEQRNKEGKAMYIPLMLRDAAEEIENRGIDKGIERGKLEVARKLMAKGVSPDIITESTGLPADQIRGLMN